MSPYNEYHGLVLQKTIVDGIHDGEFNGTLLCPKVGTMDRNPLDSINGTKQRPLLGTSDGTKYYTNDGVLDKI